VVHSFEVELPAMVGKESTSGVTRDGRALPGSLRSRKGTQVVDSEVRSIFSPTTSSRKTDFMKDKIAMHLDGEAREVARQMLDDSVWFVQELSVWISTHYDEVKSRSGT
jgi:hypothetical protein